MSSVRQVTFSVLLIGASVISGMYAVLFPFPVYSYSETTTHPALTDEIVDFYNLFFDKEITSEEKEWVVRGSIDEDTFPRYVNHFYDPVYQKGWIGVGASSKEWGRSSAAQSRRASQLASVINVANGAILTLNDFSWERGIKEYAKGNRQYAFLALGHVLHLLEDSSVPEHTRNDTHIAGNHHTNSPYEDWAKKFARSTFHVTQELQSQGVRPKRLGSYDEYFDQIAWYSNRYFFSEDTILLKKYSLPTIHKKALGINSRGNNVLFAYGKDESDSEFLLAILKGDITWRNLGEKRTGTLSDLIILSAYWSRLAPKAITYGAGLTRLFIEEGERAKVELAKNPPKENFLAALIGLVKGAFNLGVTPAFDEQHAALAIRNKFTTLDESVDENLNFIEEKPTLVSKPSPSSVPSPQSSPTPQALSLPPNVSAVPSSAASPGTAVSSPTQNDSANKTLSDESKPAVSPVISPSSPNESNVLPTSLPFPILAPKQYIEPLPTPTPTPTPTPALAPTPAPDTTPPTPPTVTNIANNQEFTAASDVDAIMSGVQIAIFGTAEANATITIFINPSWIVTADGLGNWSETITLNEGTNIISIKAKDAAGNESTATMRTVTLDSIAPQPTIGSSDYVITKLNYTVGWGLSTTTPDFADYDVEQRVGASNVWTTLYSQTTVTATTSTSTREIMSYFRVRARDAKGNVSSWVEAQAETNQHPVVVNEIMYNPSPGNDDYYEYIELYNRSSTAIDLANWTLTVDGDTHQFLLDGTATGTSMVLPAGGFALIGDKRINQNHPHIYDGLQYVIPAHSSAALRLTIDDATLGNGASLRNSPPWSLITLKDDTGFAVDELTYNSGAGGNGNGTSIERVNPSQGGDTLANWAASPAGGTPNQQNSVYNAAATPGTTIADTTNITVDTIWSKAGSPYLIVSNLNKIPQISQGATLYVEPGVTIRPQSASYTTLDVKGALKAEGTQAEPILITSKNTGLGVPQRGDWRDITFSATASGSLLKHITIEYGGAGFVGMISVAGSDVTFENATFRQAKDNALVIMAGLPTVKNSAFSDNGTFGIDITGGSPAIEYTNFTGNTGPARFSPETQPTFRGNAALNNMLYNALYVKAGSIATNTVWAKDLPYLLESNAGQFITVASSTTLTLEPGVILKPLNKYYDNLVVSGSLSAVGTIADPITVTSLKNDGQGGDSDANGLAGLPAAGDWKRILFKIGSSSILQNLRVEYGGFGGFAALTFEQGATTATSSITFNNNIVNSQGP